MNRVVVNIIFIILISLVIFPVKEASELLLAQQNNQTSSNKDDDDDDGDATADFAKKIDFKLKFEFITFDDVVYLPKEVIITNYIHFGVLLPLNHAADVQTPPPNC